MCNRSFSATFLVLLAAIVLTANTTQAQSQWSGPNDATSDIYRTGKVGVMTSNTPSSQFHVFTAADKDGIAVDGTSNPSINFRNNSTIQGYLGLVTQAGAFFAGSVVNSLALQSGSGNIYLGVGTGSSAPTMTILGSKVGIGKPNPAWTFHVSALNNGNAQITTGEIDLEVSSAAAQPLDGSIHNTAAQGYAFVSSGSPTVSVVTGTEGDAENYSSGHIQNLKGTWGWAYNANASAIVNYVTGAEGWVEIDGGTVTNAAEFWGWEGVYGGTVTNLYGAFLVPNNSGATVTNSYGVFAMPQGAATNRYGVYIGDGSGAATNDYGLYQAGSAKKNYFAGPVSVGGSGGAFNLNVFGTAAITGEVGIGTTAPGAGYALDVNGAIHASGAITGSTVYANYQDVAEWVPASNDALEPGTVVVLNPARTNEVTASSTAYDTTVAGVVSEHPGIVLGKGGADKAQIATTGRVKVKVDARRAPIKIGDLLVTSDIAGTAMRSEPIEIRGRRFHQPGTIVGKALEPLDGGSGEILVLLSLQ